MANELRIGPVALEDKIDPTDPNEPGQIAGPQGARYDTLKIIQAVADSYAQLSPFQVLRKDEERSEHLDLQEVHDAADLPDDVVVEGAGVKGTSNDPDQLVVVYVARWPGPEHAPEAGRSAKGVVRYNLLRRSIDAYERDQELQLGAARAARSAGGDEETYGEDPRVERLDKALSDMEERLQKAEARAKEAEERAAAAEAAQAEAEAAAASAEQQAEPFPGYGEANVDDVKAAIKAAPEGPEREALKVNVRRAEEQRETPRQGVLEATAPAEQ